VGGGRYAFGGAVRVPADVLAQSPRLPGRDRRGLPGRWGIEELCKVSKRLVGAEQFHARTERGIGQELSAHFNIIAAARSFGNLTEQAVGAPA